METRKKVQMALRLAGYKPDPQMSRLMSMIRGRKTRRVCSALAVIRYDDPDGALRDPAYQYVSFDDIRRRAQQQGYDAEPFHLGNSGLKSRRIESILKARGIEGIIVMPQSSTGKGPEIDYSRYAAATFGYGLIAPALHRVSTNMMQGVLLATTNLAARGYRRIGLAVTQWVDMRADHSYAGAMLYYYQTIPAKDRLPLLLFPNNNLESGRDIFCRWVKAHRPDVIISFHRYVLDWLTRHLKLRVPEDIGLVVHDWTDSMKGLAGIYHRRNEVAAAAVDVVSRQLLQNERGIPKVPRQILIPAGWMEGGSIAPLTESR